MSGRERARILVVDDDELTLAVVRKMLQVAGFQQIRIQPKDESRELIRERAPKRHIDGVSRRVEDYVVSATIEAVKPAN